MPSRKPYQFGLASLFVLTDLIAVGAWASTVVGLMGVAFVAFAVTVILAWLIAVVGIIHVITQVARYTEQLVDWIGRKTRH
jgi:hypothetical protein